MSAVHDIRKTKHNSVSPKYCDATTREYNAKEFNEYLNKLVKVENWKPTKLKYNIYDFVIFIINQS